MLFFLCAHTSRVEFLENSGGQQSRFYAIGGPEATVDFRQMRLYGGEADEQCLANVGIGQPACQGAKHPSFGFTQFEVPHQDKLHRTGIGNVWSRLDHAIFPDFTQPTPLFVGRGSALQPGEGFATLGVPIGLNEMRSQGGEYCPFLFRKIFGFAADGEKDQGVINALPKSELIPNVGKGLVEVSIQTRVAPLTLTHEIACFHRLGFRAVRGQVMLDGWMLLHVFEERGAYGLKARYRTAQDAERGAIYQMQLIVADHLTIKDLAGTGQ